MQSTWVLALGSTSQAPSVSMLEGAVTLHVHDRTYLNALTLEPVLSGLGVVEVPDKQTALELKEVNALLKEFKENNPDFELWLEPGRFLIAEAVSGYRCGYLTPKHLRRPSLHGYPAKIKGPLQLHWGGYRLQFSHPAHPIWRIPSHSEPISSSFW